VTASHLGVERKDEIGENMERQKTRKMTKVKKYSNLK
jgi:hypothetical protein